MNGLIAIFFALGGLFVVVMVVAIVLAEIEVWAEISIREFWVGLKIVPFQGTTYVLIAPIPCVVLVTRRRWRGADAIAPPSIRKVR